MKIVMAAKKHWEINRKSTLVLGTATIAVTILAGLAGYTYITKKIQDDAFSKPIEISGKNISEDTLAIYEVQAGKQIIARGQARPDKSGSINLVVSDLSDDLKQKDKVTYKVKLESYKNKGEAIPADTVSMLLEVHKKTGKVILSGEGLDEFHNLDIESSEQKRTVKSDWAGIISNLELNNYISPDSKDSVKLAFQSNKFSKEAAEGNESESVYEVLIPPFFPSLPRPPLPIWGDSSGSSIAAVEARYGMAIRRMTLQLSAVMGMQVGIIGTLIDAKTQLEVQRKIQELQARAHKDYHPSEEICQFGSFVKSLANTEGKASLNKYALNRILMDQYLGVRNSHTAEGPSDAGGDARREHYRNVFCGKRDNNASLDLVCNIPSGLPPQERINKDIDYSRTLDNPLSLDIDFSNNVLTPDEENIITLAQNLYFPQIYEVPDTKMLVQNNRFHYATRSLASKLNVAHSSFLNVMGMKTASVPGVAAGFGEDAGWAYMKTLLRGYGMSLSEIEEYLGHRPSYYAQMEVLTKVIYQNPRFYTNLIDKPANVDRINVTLQAIELMNQRDRYESLLRSEVLAGVLVEQALEGPVEELTTRMFENMQQRQK